MNLKSTLLSLTLALALPAVASGQSKAADFTPFDNPAEIKMTPAQGVVTSLHEFTVSVPSAQMLDFTPSEDVTLTNQANGKLVCNATFDYGDGMTDLTLTLDQEVTEPGTYVLTIPAGAIYNDGGSSSEDYPETKWLYIIEGGETPTPQGPFENDPIYTINPAQGTVTNLTELVLSLNTTEQVWPADAPEGFITDAVTGAKVSDISYDYGDTDQEVAILVDTPITTAGSYILNIPEGDIYYYDADAMDMVYFPACKWLYTVKPGEDPNPDPEEPKPFVNPDGYVMHPDQGEVGTLQTFYLEVPDCYVDLGTGDKSTLVNYATGEVVGSGKFDFIDPGEQGYDDNSTVKLVLEKKIAEPGTYVLTVAPASINVDYSYDNPELKYLYTVTGKEDPVIPDPEPEFPAIDNPGISIDPAQGVVESLAMFTVTFFDEDMIFIDGYMPEVDLKDEATGDIVTSGFMEEGNNSNEVAIWLDEKVTADGTYLLVIPGGLISSMEEDFIDDINFRFRIGAEPEKPEIFDNPGFTMDPAQGVVPSMRQFVIAYSEAGYLDYDSELVKDIALTDQKTGEKICGVTVDENPEDDTYTSLIITLDQTVTAAGTYVLDIPEGAFYDYFVPSEPLPASKWLYIIEGSEEPELKPFENEGVVITPEQGKYTSLESFTLVFDIQMPAINYTKEITLVDNASGEVVANGKATEGAMLNVMLIDLDKAVTTPGAYTLICPAGTFYDGASWDEEDLPEFKFAYLVAEDGTTIEPVVDKYFVNPDPADGEVKTLEKIIITYPDYSSVYINRYCEEAITVTAEGSSEIVATGAMSLEGAGNEMTITFSEPIVDRGTYTVNIPKRAMTLGDMSQAKFSEPVELTYQVSGADGIGSVIVDINSDTELYNLQGIRVSNPVAGQVYLVRQANKFVKVLVK